MNPSRRDFLKGAGALIVSFSAGEGAWKAAGGQGQFSTHDSHIDPKNLDSWIALSADGTVTAYTGKCDFGQGIFTAQTQLVAEELCVALDRVKLIQCDTAGQQPAQPDGRDHRRHRNGSPARLHRQARNPAGQ